MSRTCSRYTWVFLSRRMLHIDHPLVSRWCLTWQYVAWQWSRVTERERGAGGGKQIYRAINCGSFRRRPLFTILHIELLFRTLFMAIQTYTRFFELCFCSSLHRTRDRCQVTASRRLLYEKNTRNFARAFFTLTAKLSRITKVRCEPEILKISYPSRFKSFCESFK